MNKKSVKVFLLCAAFIGVSGGFVSCSDDYDDDIETLNVETSSLSSQLSTLQSALAAAQSTASSAASAATTASSDAAAAQSAAEKAQAEAEEASALATQAAATAKAEAIEEAIAQVETLLTGVPTKEDLEALATQISAIDADLLKITNTVNENSAAILALQTQMGAIEEYIELLQGSETLSNVEETVSKLETSIADIKDAIGDLEDRVAAVEDTLEGISDQIAAIAANLVTIQGDKLRSLVFIPNLYVDGVEAARYPYSYGYYIIGAKGKETGTAYDGEAYAFTKDAVTTFSTGSGTTNYYALAPQAQLAYHVNPTSADLTGVAWDFDELDSEFITRTAATNWQANYVSSSKENGILTVNYTIKNADKLTDPGTDEKLSVLSLEATLANDTTVNSDYAAIVPAVRELKAIAFTVASKYETANTCNIGAVELYETAKEAAESAASIEAQYNAGSKDLASYLAIHYAQSDYDKLAASADCAVMAASELENWGLSFEFEKVPYVLGSNNTEETAYCTLDEDGTFTPAYVDASGNPIAIGASTGTTGISSVGRLPIVLAKLVDANGKVLLAGYIKIEIVKEEDADPTTRSYILSTGNEYGYTCDASEKEVTWSEVSSNIYEELGMTKDQFVATYTPQPGTYIKKADGTFATTTLYGKIEESTDTNVTSATTDVIKWTGDADDKAAIYAADNHSVTLYIQYEAASGDIVYFGIEISIADLPTVTFTQKTEAYWYPATETVADRDTVRMNVPVPYPAADNVVTDYVKDLDEYFVGDKVTTTLATGNTNYYKTSNISYVFRFSKTQPKIGSYQLSTNTLQTSLLATGGSVINEEIATIDQATGELAYSNESAVAKEILNLYGHLVPNTYAKVEIAAFYGSCGLALNTETFNIRFLRPVDILDGEDANFIDAQANGSSVLLSKLFSLKDWREKPVFSATYPSGYTDNGVNLYDYYRFESITIDIDNATCNAAGSVMKVSAVSSNLQLAVTDGNGNALSNTVSISNTSALTSTYITYTNNGANVQTFNLWIPVIINYSWGTLEGEISAVVNSTIANQ